MSRAERLHDKIEETKRAVFVRDRGMCQVAGCVDRMTQCAHVLPNDELHLELYGDEVINHPANMKGACGLKHNAKLQINHRGHPLAANQWAEVVRSVIKGESQ